MDIDFTQIGNIVLAVLGISFLIFIHEAGHFLAARLFGVRVEVFSIGFGPRLWGSRKGDTDYRISAIPLGGYVKMAGEYGDYGDDAPLADDDLNAQPIWQRAIIFSGGVLVNFAFAFIAFPVVFAMGASFASPVIGWVQPGGAAWQAGIRPGDRIVEIGGQRTLEFGDIVLKVALGDPTGIPAVVDRDGTTFETVLHPTRNVAAGRNEIGIDLADGDELIVEEDSPAWRADLRSGDLLVAVNGVELAGHPSARLRCREMAVIGEPMEVVVDRGGRRVTVRVVPEARIFDPEALLIGVRQPEATVVGLRGDARDTSGFPLALEDTLLDIDGQVVADDQGIMRALAAAPAGQVTLHVQRAGEQVDLTLSDADRAAILGGDVAFGVEPGDCRVRVTSDGAVAEAGMRDGDYIRAIDGQTILTYTDLVQTLRDSRDSRHSVRFWRPDEDREDLVVIEARPGELPWLGFGIQPHTTTYKYGIVDAIGAGFQTSINGLRHTWLTLVKLISGQVGTQNLGGIVEISRQTYHFADLGMAKLLLFLALLSINLGFINILPIPVLDGGQILFLLFEKIKGSRLSERFLNGAQLAGLVAILVLVVYVTYNDIKRLL